MAYLIYLVKGFFIGIAKILPGVSGAMLAMSFGVYDDAIHAIRHYRQDLLKNTFFLGSLGIGVITAMVCFSHVVSFALNHYYLTTMLLFIGLILGGMTGLYKKVSHHHIRIQHIFVFMICCLFILWIRKFQIHESALEIISPFKMFIYMIMIGFIDAITMIIPGISGTAIFMILGFYPLFLSMIQKLGSISSILNSMGTFFPYGLGLFLGILIAVWIMDYLLNRHHEVTYYGILGLSSSSILFLFFETLSKNYTVTDIVAGLMCLVIGYYLGHKFE